MAIRRSSPRWQCMHVVQPLCSAAHLHLALHACGAYCREEDAQFSNSDVAAKRSEALRKAEERERLQSQELRRKYVRFCTSHLHDDHYGSPEHPCSTCAPLWYCTAWEEQGAQFP